jgi:hypothetical protein
MKLTLIIILITASSQWGFSQCNNVVLRKTIDNRPFIDELFAIQQGKVRVNSFYISYHMNKKDTIYCIADSSLFTGSILQIDREENGRSISYHTWEIKDGINVAHVRNEYTAWGNLFTGAQDYPDSVWLRSLSQNDLNTITNFQEGTLASRISYRSSVDSLGTREKYDSIIQYHKNGILKYVEVNNNSIGAEHLHRMYLDERKTFDTNQIITNHTRNIDFVEGKTHVSSAFEINQFQDTILLETFWSSRREGRCIQNCTIRLSYGEDSTIAVASKWKNNRLLDIEERNVVFLDKKHRVISKAEFIEQSKMPYTQNLFFSKLRNFDNWFLPTYHDDFDWVHPIPLEKRRDNHEELVIVTQNWKVKRLNYSRMFRQIDRKMQK